MDQLLENFEALWIDEWLPVIDVEDIPEELINLLPEEA